MHNSGGDRLSNLLGAAALTVAERLTRAAGEAAGVSGSGAAALVTLRTAEGIGGTELARRIGLSQSACTRLLDQLAAHGYVRRAPARGRLVAVHLTQEGATATDAVRRARQDSLDRVLASLDPTQREALQRALEPVLTALYDELGSEDLLCRLCDRGACLADGHSCPVGAAARARAAGESGERGDAEVRAGAERGAGGGAAGHVAGRSAGHGVGHGEGHGAGHGEGHGAGHG